MARQNTGSIRRTKRGFVGRLWIVVGHVDGKPVRERHCYDLATDVRSIALAKLASIREQAEQGGPEPIKRGRRAETLSEAVERIVPGQGLQTWRERLSRLRRYCLPLIGPLEVSRVGPRHVKEVLESAHTAGLARESVVHLRSDLLSVFGELRVEEAVKLNPVRDYRLDRKRLRRERRRRVMLNDAEFAALMASPDISAHVRMMSLTSRTFGGQRTSDLHAWDWLHIDTPSFAVAEVYRPKTDGPEGDDEDGEAELVKLVIPEMLRGPLRAWWEAAGRPESGPVFPIRLGKRAGERQGKRSHAKDLRRALWRAGVHRPLPGFAEAMERLQAATEAVEKARQEGPKSLDRRKAWWEAQRERRAAKQAAMALDAMQTSTKRTRAIDFHSLRRAYATALARSGLNMQAAMALAGHKNTQTHMRYVILASVGALEAPPGALPQLLPALQPSPPEATNSHESGLLDPPPMAAGAENLSSITGDPNGIRTRITGVRESGPLLQGSSLIVKTSAELEIGEAAEELAGPPNTPAVLFAGPIGPVPALSVPRAGNIGRLPVGERAELLALLNRQLPLLRNPSPERELALDAIRLLESSELDAAKAEGA